MGCGARFDDPGEAKSTKEIIIKLILSPAETQEAFAKFYPVPAGYGITGVNIQPYSSNAFCTIELEKTADAVVVPIASEAA